MDKTAIELKRDERIAALEKKKQQLGNRITRLRNIKSTKKRKLETRRKILAGSWLLDRAAKNPDSARRLLQGLNGFLTRPQDRALFDLPTKMEAPK